MMSSGTTRHESPVGLPRRHSSRGSVRRAQHRAAQNRGNRLVGESWSAGPSSREVTALFGSAWTTNSLGEAPSTLERQIWVGRFAVSAGTVSPRSPRVRSSSSHSHWAGTSFAGWRRRRLSDPSHSSNLERDDRRTMSPTLAVRQGTLPGQEEPIGRQRASQGPPVRPLGHDPPACASSAAFRPPLPPTTRYRPTPRAHAPGLSRVHRDARHEPSNRANWG
jgi:hypothetical protein